MCRGYGRTGTYLNLGRALLPYYTYRTSEQFWYRCLLGPGAAGVPVLRNTTVFRLTGTIYILILLPLPVLILHVPR